MGVEVLPSRIVRGEPKPIASGSRSRYIRMYLRQDSTPPIILCCDMRSTVTRCTVVAPSAPHLVCGDVGAEGSRKQIWWGLANVEHVPQWKRAPWTSCQIALDCATACYRIDQWLLL